MLLLHHSVTHPTGQVKKIELKSRMHVLQIGTASGFMRMATGTVSLILSLIQHAPIRGLFLEPGRAAPVSYTHLTLPTILLV